jgi:cytochrome c-type biogenesis protein CcsB
VRNLTFVLALLFSFSSWAQMDFCTEDLETFPVQAGGREKPLYVLATDSIRFITGEKMVGDMSATVAFCKLSLKVFGMPLELPVKVRIDHVDVKKLLEMDEKENSMPVQDIFAKASVIETKLAELKENNSFKKELTKVSQRMGTYQAIIEGRAWMVPMKKADKIVFVTLPEFLTEERVSALSSKGINPVKALMSESRSDYVAAKGDHYLLELTYFKLNLFMWAMLVSILAALLMAGLKNKLPGSIAIGITVGLQIAAMTMRVMISGRAPVTNMYETVMFSGFGALVVSCIITFIRKDSIFALAGLGYNILCLMMMKFANGMLDPGISPLVPVLRDNFWLSTHVTTVILSYASLALSWMLANSLMIRSRFFKVTAEEYRYQSDLIYTSIKVGTVMLATGVILGGVWADYSWGRFWGWDPKETWSLIVLLVYMAILHGRYSSWIPPKRFVPLVAGAFMSVMMAWFGVNYILASGLHSYGFSEGGAIFLGSFFAAQIALLLMGTVGKKTA